MEVIFVESVTEAFIPNKMKNVFDIQIRLARY